jgi:erythromycin esterase
MKYFISLFLTIQTLNSFCQNTIAWLQKNVLPISTTDQYVNNAKEYEPLKKILQGKDIVLLGEEDHVFATTFESKTKLIKFLHDEMGFTVLAFEYDLYSLANGYNKAVSENNPEVLKNYLYPFWSQVKSTETLFPYIIETAKTNTPLKVIGFDCQTLNQFPLLDRIETYLTIKKSVILKYNYYLKCKEIFEKAYSEAANYQYKLSDTEKLLLFNVIDDILTEMELDGYKTTQSKITQQSLLNFKNNVSNLWLDRPSNYAMTGQPTPSDTVYGFVADRQSMGSYNRRDKLMAENIKWMKDVLYPNEKVIIWASSEHTIYNRHLAKFHNLLVDSSFAFNGRFKNNRNWETMGTHLKKYYGRTIYNLGFTTLSGQVNYDRTGVNNYMEEITIGENSLESFLVRLKLKNGILNFDKTKPPSEIKDPLLFHSIFGGLPNTSGDITSFFDGIYFVGEMKPLEFKKK